MDSKSVSQRIKDIEEKLADLQAQWPAHSVKPWMLQKFEDLEEELAQLKAPDDIDTNDHSR